MRPFNERFTEFWSELGEVEQIAIWNEYAYNGSYEPVYDMDELNEIASSMQPLDLARNICGGDFNPRDNYFRATIWGFESTDYPVREWIADEVDSLADFYEDHEDLLTDICSEAEELYEEEEEEETEEEDI